MADCTQKLQASVIAAVESWQFEFNSLIVQHVRLNRALTPLFDLQYKQQSIRTAGGQWQCDASVVSGAALSGLAISAPPPQKKKPFPSLLFPFSFSFLSISHLLFLIPCLSFPSSPFSFSHLSPNLAKVWGKIVHIVNVTCPETKTQQSHHALT